MHRPTRSVRGDARSAAMVASAVAAALLLAACSGGATTPGTSGSGSGASPTTSGSAGSPSPTVSPTPPAGYGTLDGLPMATLAQVRRPIVVVDVGWQAGAATPTGLGQADVVYQEFDSAGHSRLVVGYQSQDSSSVGPVAATAPVDWRITSLWALPVLAFAGGPTGFVKQVGPTVVTPRSSSSFATLFHRSGAFLYASTAALRASAPKAAPAPAGLLNFGTTASQSPHARKVSRLTVSVPGQPTQTWVWNGRLWTGPGGVTATSVVVQDVTYKSLKPAKDPAVASAQVLGSGQGVVVTGNAGLGCAWYRRELVDITNFVDAGSQPIRLLPGRSWIILAPPGTKAVLA